MDRFDITCGPAELRRMLTFAPRHQRAVRTPVLEERTIRKLPIAAARNDLLHQDLFRFDKSSGLGIPRAQLLHGLDTPRFGTRCVKEVLLDGRLYRQRERVAERLELLVGLRTERFWTRNAQPFRQLIGLFFVP